MVKVEHQFVHNCADVLELSKLTLKQLLQEDMERGKVEGEVKSPLKWTGGKFYIADWIISLMPKHSIYIEPFFGAGWVFFKKPKVHIEVINDIDDRIYALFKVLSDEELFQQFLEKVWFVGTSEKIYTEMLERLNGGACDMVEKAVAFFYVNRFSLSGNLNYRFVVSKVENKALAYEKVKDSLLKIHDRLKNVAILNRDWKDIVEKYDSEDVLFYIDPPYVLETRNSEGVYAYEMTDEEHEELVDICSGLKGRVIISGYKNRIYERLERSGWIRLDKEISLMATAVKTGEAREKRIESVWLNYKPNCLRQKILFSISVEKSSAYETT
jgi:DNA adenine methylase